jgi:pimeloyl-ACP methyl ester carboxylesterase
MEKKLFIDDLEEITEHDEEALNMLKRRAMVAIGLVLLFLLIIISRFWYLQINLGEHYRALAENNRVRIRSVPPPRGHIFDRDGREIVTNRPSFNVVMIREDSFDIDDSLKRLAQVLDVPSDVIGHSIGGKAAMVLALSRPELVRRLVVADIAPVAYGHTQAHLIEAMQTLNLNEIESRRDADMQLSQRVEDPSVRAFLLQSLDVKAKKWRLNLDVLDAEMPKVMSFPEISGQFDGPTLFLTGADSDYVSRDHRGLIKSMFPNARFAKLPGAGHWLHADQPRAFEAAVRTYFDAG